MKVMLATPCYSGYLHHAHATSVMYAVGGGPANGVSWHRFVAPGNPVLPRVRNVLSSLMLAPQPDGVDFAGILFIDDDIAFKPADAARIVKHGRQVVAGVAQKRVHKWNEPAEINAAIDDGAPLEPNGLLQNALVPSCFLWIHRSVFEGMLASEELHNSGLVRRFIYPALPDHAQPYCATYFGYGLASPRPGGVEERLAKRLGVEDALVDIGEDYDFSIKCDVIGVPRFIDTEIELIHYDGRVAHDLSFKKMQEAGVVDLETRPPAFGEAA